ncbi:MAG: hypothetical protein ABSE67_10200 [Xanthobacteraceae bacterium]|jgi:hypothetical protein
MTMEPAAEVVPAKSVRSRAKYDRKSHGRSRITNGNELLHGLVDSRTVWVRRCRDIIASHISDLGGADNVSTAELSIVRRVATLTVVLEQFETKFANAGAASGNELSDYQAATGNLRRLLESIGIRGRRAVDVTPRSLRAQLQAEADAAAEIEAAESIVEVA